MEKVIKFINSWFILLLNFIFWVAIIGLIMIGTNETSYIREFAVTAIALTVYSYGLGYLLKYLLKDKYVEYGINEWGTLNIPLIILSTLRAISEIWNFVT